MFSTLLYTFYGLSTLAALGAALQFRDGSTLFGMAIIWLGILALDYVVARRRQVYASFPAYLKDHRGRIVLLVVGMGCFAISVWAFFAGVGPVKG